MIKALGSKYIIDRDKKTSEYYSIIKDLLENPDVIRLNCYRHHKYSTRYQHCINVSYYSYIICRALRFDYVAAARGALLHDFFFYERKKRTRKTNEPSHAYIHPRLASRRASVAFNISNLEEDIILNHMWPFTLTFPKYRETYIVDLVDNGCAVMEASLFVFNKFLK